MKLEILLIALLCTVKATRKVNGSLLKIEEEGSGNDNSEPLKKSIEKIESKIDGALLKKQVDDTDSSNGSGDDEDGRDTDSEGSGASGDDFSGSGKLPTVVKVKTTLPPSFKSTTDRKNLTSTVIDINLVTTTEKASVDISIVPTTNAKKASTAKNDATEKKSTAVVVQPERDDVNGDIVNVLPTNVKEITPDDGEPSAARSANPENKENANFTVAIVVGVVVGAILSILIIVFLVYRLRKKDEGSYSLDEPSSAMLRADTDSPPPKGKGEYYA